MEYRKFGLIEKVSRIENEKRKRSGQASGKLCKHFQVITVKSCESKVSQILL